MTTLMVTKTPIKYALISTFDKQGIVELVSTLSLLGVQIIATGGTYQRLKQHGINAIEISDYTNFPEILNGRVKSLHPKIYAGILARRNNPDDISTLKAHQCFPIDIIVANLYPFSDTIKQAHATMDDAIEHIDIGGPTMIRAAAKNFKDVTVLVDPADYPSIISELKQTGTIPLSTRKQLAAKAFKLATEYNNTIYHYLNDESDCLSSDVYPDAFAATYTKAYDLRYGENPQQHAACYKSSTLEPSANLLSATILQGKPLSYNNLIDGDAALNIIKRLPMSSPACAIIKHATPCGVASASTLIDAYRNALRCDSQSAFGGIIALNQSIDRATASEIMSQQFVEVIIAPRVSEEAAIVFSKKPNIRVICVGELTPPNRHSQQIKSIANGVLIQNIDYIPLDEQTLSCVTNNQPTAEQYRDLRFAWVVVQAVKSNAIVYAGNHATLGIGSGQTSRVFSAEIAALKAEKAGLSLASAVMASDAFLPFPDTLDIAHRAGITAVIQPGGSKNDALVIQRANELNISMVMTASRHFLH